MKKPYKTSSPDFIACYSDNKRTAVSQKNDYNALVDTILEPSIDVLSASDGQTTFRNFEEGGERLLVQAGVLKRPSTTRAAL